MITNELLTRLPSLRMFAEAATRGSFKAAADQLHIAPSAVSKQIRSLEDVLNVELFRRGRGRGGLELTEAGEILLFRCASVINELDIAREELSELKGLKRGHLRVGVNEVVASDLLPGILDDMHRNHPNLRYSIFVENSPLLLPRLHDGEIDLALGYNFPASAQLEMLAILHRKTYLITARDHPLARYRKVNLSAIEGENFIMPDPNLSLHEMLQAALLHSKVNVNQILTTNSFSLLRQMVEQGMGVSIVIGRFLRKTRENIAFIEIEDPNIVSRPLSCCRAAERAPTASSSAFSASVKTLFAQYGG